MKIYITYLSVIIEFLCVYGAFLCQRVWQAFIVMLIAIANTLVFVWSLDGDV